MANVYKPSEHEPNGNEIVVHRSTAHHYSSRAEATILGAQIMDSQISLMQTGRVNTHALAICDNVNDMARPTNAKCSIDRSKGFGGASFGTLL